MRTVLVALVALGALLGLAPAAHAKGPTAAVIEGPGLGTPVKIESDRPPGLGTLMQRTGGSIMVGDWVDLAPDRPAVELGPRYLVTYYIGKQPVLTQELYPFTAKGSYTFTPAGQLSLAIRTALPGGWFRAPDELAADLTLLVTPRPAAPQQQPQPQPVAVETPSVPLGWWLAGALVVLALAGAAVRRGRKVSAQR